MSLYELVRTESDDVMFCAPPTLLGTALDDDDNQGRNYFKGVFFPSLPYFASPFPSFLPFYPSFPFAAKRQAVHLGSAELACSGVQCRAPAANAFWVYFIWGLQLPLTKKGVRTGPLNTLSSHSHPCK